MDYLLEVIGVEISLPNPITVGMALLLSLIFFLTFLLVTGLSYLQLPKLIDSLFNHFASNEFVEIYQKVITPYYGWLSWVIILTIIDLVFLVIPAPIWLKFLEFPLGLLVAINIIFLGFKLFIELFEDYLLEVLLEEDKKINSELLTLAKFLTKAVIVLIVVFLFAQAHQINLIGLVASLGIGGITIAFASQKVLEQVLWSIVLYIDRPFTVDDYIHLQDGTLGRVESIGWRSTKVRLSGKNTLVVVPNSNLAQVNIENLSGASRVILMVNFTFLRSMSDEERALIEQLILGSTREILGIDHQLTKITFHDLSDETGSNHVQAQVVFFILGAAQTSMELRKNLLEIARASIIDRLHDYGITFKFEEKIIDIAQPMNI